MAVDHFTDSVDGSGSFGDGAPTNFTVTITQDGRTVDSVSVNNFRGNPEGEPLIVYELVN